MLLPPLPCKINQLQCFVNVVVYAFSLSVALVRHLMFLSLSFIVTLQFLETGPELGNHYNEVIAPQDVATYGGLCALATFDRMELKAYVLSFLLTISL